jgi:hypothetical protein
MKIKNEKLENMHARSSVATLGNLVISYRRMRFGDVPATPEVCAMMRDTIKELCADISAWADWFYLITEESSEHETSVSKDLE